jgi:hypothetical protein
LCSSPAPHHATNQISVNSCQFFRFYIFVLQ